MAFPATIYGAEKDVYETGTFQQYPLGQKLITPGGSVFRYAEMGATLGVANNLYQAAAPTAGWLSQALITTAMAVGDTTINFRPDTTAIAADELAGGTVLVEETDDLGHVYRIKSNTAAAGGADGTLTLEDGVTVKVAVAIAASNVLTVIKNPWKDIIIHPTTKTAIAVGVPRVVIAANAYGWVCTRGVASCLVAGTHTIGDPVCPALAAAGALSAKRRSATAAVLSGGLAVTVTHGLGGTPTLGNIKITGGENASTPVDKLPWVDTIGATTFAINVTVDPGVSNQDFGWSAELDGEILGNTIEVAPTADFGHIFLTIE